MQAEFMLEKNSMKLDPTSNIDFVDQNSRYMDLLYKDNPIIFDNWAIWIKENLKSILSKYNIPSGNIVQAGTWNGDMYFTLQDIFGKENCIGFDIENYIDDDSIIYGDFRKIHKEHPISCSLFYNGLGSWKCNTISKQAGLDYAIQNLVPNGLYLDVIHKDNNILKDIPNLEYCNTYDNKLIILKKI
jgi:hypothetical protein